MGIKSVWPGAEARAANAGGVEMREAVGGSLRAYWVGTKVARAMGEREGETLVRRRAVETGVEAD